MISVGILEIMWIWNDYLLPYLVLDRTNYLTIPIHIQYLKGSYGTVDLGATMALILLSIIPVIVFYLTCQKHIIKGGPRAQSKDKAEKRKGVTRLTIKDLAKLSGYSLGTVSRVLNNQPNVSEQARKTILALVEAHGFERNASAQLLKQQRTKSVLIVVKGTSNEMFAAMVEKLQSLFADTDHPVIADFIDEDENEVRRAAQLCREKAERRSVSRRQQRKLPGRFRQNRRAECGCDK